MKSLSIERSVASIFLASQVYFVLEGKREEVGTLVEDFPQKLGVHPVIHKVKETVLHTCLFIRHITILCL